MPDRWWKQTPEIDGERKVGLGLIDVLFGLVLAQAFIPTSTGDYHKIGLAGYSQLGLAVVVIVLSWIGYHNNRRAGNLWALKFVNLPLWQYVVDVLIIGAYWMLTITTEHIEPSHFDTSALPEAVSIAVIFGLYFAWDYAEVTIHQNPRYVTALTDAHLNVTPQRDDVETRHLAILGWSWQRPYGSREFYANPAVPMRAVTFCFLVLYGVSAIVIAVCLPVRGRIMVPVIDAAYAVSLLAYRIIQTNIAPWACRNRPNPQQ